MIIALYIHDKLLPYSPDDTVRWQNVMFEKFNTISIGSAGSFKLKTDNKIRTTEYYGNIGRLCYGYEADIIKHILTLKIRADMSDIITLQYNIPSTENSS
ncbi:hypothetical protein [Mucilaginibacter kameinonensis]|uniref:hypothetical protein n=1 Tax=Mucilaginibacter kameinonensis TaxID=452286 RepID=UPI000EF84B00|nr:hypothetical protein [Mucilaginibacter kameinonensis]